MTTTTRRVRTVLAAAAAGALALTSTVSAQARGQGRDRHHHRDYTFAVIGDIPYGEAQIANFPKVIAQINADPSVRWVDHLGDIKDGSSACSDAYFEMIRKGFERFADPLVYTIGDNEWTDCHRPADGGYNPLERLAKVRSLFFAHPGRTLGQHRADVVSQADQGLPEDVRWERAGMSFATLHIVGSNNGLEPWTGQTQPTPSRPPRCSAVPEGWSRRSGTPSPPPAATTTARSPS